VTYYYLLDTQGFDTELQATNLDDAISEGKLILAETTSNRSRWRHATVVESTDEGDGLYPIDVIVEAETDA
jgi:hypothetical protein